jgi:hypothetical protein
VQSQSRLLARMTLLRNIGIEWKKSLVSQPCDGETKKGLGNGIAHQWFGAIPKMASITEEPA